MPIVDWSRIVSQLIRITLPAYFLVHSAALATLFVVRGVVGIDARIYSAAARAWLDGGDPWATAVGGYYFAAPPPTLLPFVPFALLGQTLSAAIWVIGSAAVALLIVRRLGLSWWWAFFPPITNGVLAGNPDVLIVALVIARNEVLGTLATFFKIYAFVPILGERQWRTAVAATAALLVTVPLLPWNYYVPRIWEIAATLDRQSIGISAFGTPWLMAGVGLALVILGPRFAGWLAVPTLWPSVQLHYSALALPALALVRSPGALLVAAVLLSHERLGFPPLAVLVLALSAVWTRMRAKRRAVTPAASGP